MTINQADTGFVTEYTYDVMIKIQDPLSMNPTASAISTIFQVYVYHKCAKNTFTISN